MTPTDSPPPSPAELQALAERLEKRAWAQSGVQLMKSAGLSADAWQEEFLTADYRRALLLCSRRSGKTTVGQLLAAKLGLRFADSDQVIEQRQQMPQARGELVAPIRQEEQDRVGRDTAREGEQHLEAGVVAVDLDRVVPLQVLRRADVLE